MKKVIILLFTCIFLNSCGRKTQEASSETVDSTNGQLVADNALSAVPKNDLYSDGKTKLIKEANYRFEVKNVKESTAAIETAIRKYPAYISSSSLKLENPLLENKMTIRIESEYFNDLLQDIDKEVIFVNVRDVSTEDVSKEFVDLESRLKTKREVEARYMNILRSKAGTIEELLEAEKQIGALHEEIEATISRMNYLKDQVRYSSINLEFYQAISEKVAANEETVSGKFKEALSAGLDGVVAVGLGLAVIWPVVLVGLMILGYLVYRKRLLKVKM